MLKKREREEIMKIYNFKRNESLCKINDLKIQKYHTEKVGNVGNMMQKPDVTIREQFYIPAKM